MKQSLQLRLSQHLALTPQLQQSIRLLQLSTLELNQELEQILSDNPMLERLDDPLDACLRIAPNGGLDAARTDTAAQSDAADGAGGQASEADGFDRRDEPRDEPREGGADDGGDAPLYEMGGDWGSEGGRSRGDGDDDEREYPQVACATESLREHLLGQLAGTGCSRRDRALVTLLIEELDADGHLGLSLEEMLSILPDELDFELEELSTALRLVQSFDPPGIGARSINECLLLQLAAIPAARRAPRDVHDCASAIVREHLELLAARDFTRLKRVLKCDDDVLRAAQVLIQSLNPRPASRFATEQPAYVVPDVVVRRTRSGWTATLNRDVMPRLRINDVYAQILKRNRSGAGGSLTSQLQEARWLIKNVQQRFDTIQRVAQAIVDRQRAFFTHGAVAMRPLVLREIADTLDLHESTVSRVTTQKYMLTPFGTLEMKYFFGSHVSTDTGGSASSTAIRAIIKQLVSAEDGKSPLSDSRIAELLGEQGVVVARRTVAKYREALQIPPVSQRKAL
jgi:RNA polymerase sigma-54 factor